MTKEPGVFSFPFREGMEEVAQYRLEGWRVFDLPKGISSKTAFFDGVRSTLPLDPPVQGNQSWDALADSLWSGLDSLTDDMILIVWPDSLEMAKLAPVDANIAKTILAELPSSLGSEEVTGGDGKKLAVINLT